MARATRSAATERAYLRFAPARRGHGGVVVPMPSSPAAGAGEEFDESDIWGALAAPAAEPPRARPLLPTRKAAAAKPVHGSLPVNIPDWSKILRDEYRAGHAGDWELDDGDDEDSVDAGAAVLVPPHELARRRRAASLSVSVDQWAGGAGRTLKVRDAVWKRTTGFQD